jgi:hypothetical protein
MDRHVGQNLAVDFDAGLVQTVDEAAVGQAGLADGSVDALDPEGAEIALLDATVARGELTCERSTAALAARIVFLRRP